MKYLERPFISIYSPAHIAYKVTYDDGVWSVKRFSGTLGDFILINMQFDSVFFTLSLEAKSHHHGQIILLGDQHDGKF